MAFLGQIDEDRIRLSAAGLFQVGIHLIPPVSTCLWFHHQLLKTRILYIVGRSNRHLHGCPDTKLSSELQLSSNHLRVTGFVFSVNSFFSVLHSITCFL